MVGLFRLPLRGRGKGRNSGGIIGEEGREEGEKKKKKEEEEEEERRQWDFYSARLLIEGYQQANTNGKKCSSK